MSLVTLIRDYVDVANSSEQLDGYTFSSLAYYTLGLLFSILKQVIVNFCTFQWVRDFSYFCLTPPMLFSSFANINVSEGNVFPSFINGVDRLTSYEHQSLGFAQNLVAFSETNFLNSVGLIFLGFFNGCFTSIHISAVNLVTIQRLLVQGVPAGLCSALGTAIGQCVFLVCVHFGFRGLLFPWLSLEPLPFFIGMGILLAIASNSAQDRRTPTIQWSAKSSLLIYTFTSVALAWCEQTALFQLMGNLSFGAEPTLLETTPSFETIETIFGNIQQVIKNSSYLLAFFLGNFLGTFFLAYALQRLLELLLSFKGIPIYYGLIKQANLPLATLIFAFGFGSLPYYGFDYLITKGFGFIPQEQLFQQTLFSPVNLVSKTSQTKEPTQGRLEDQLALLFTLEGEKNKSFVVDTTPFDDGQYLKAGQKRPQAFEDLNYRGEHLWTNRLSRISNIREQANQTQSSFLGPVFSWMRSFLWGTTSNANFNKNSSNSLQSEALTPSGYTKETLQPPVAQPYNNEFSLAQSDSNAPIASLSSGYNEAASRPKENQKDLSLRLLTERGVALHGKESKSQRKELSAERKQLDNYVKEFDQQFDKGFSNYHNAEPISLIEVEDQWQEQRIKKKCYTNPIYTFLLNIEIDLFLGRQPNYHRLSAEEEILLLKRRQLLSNYYDTLALTSQIPTSQTFNQLVPKSYTNAIYNHQFKGTLKIARRLFSIKNALPTFDQPLFSKENVLPNSVKSQLENSDFVPYRSSTNSYGVKETSTSLPSHASLYNEQEEPQAPAPLTPKKEQLRSRYVKEGLAKRQELEQKKILFHEELNSNPIFDENAEENELNEIITNNVVLGKERQTTDLSNKESLSSAKLRVSKKPIVAPLTPTESKKQLPLANAFAKHNKELRDKNVFLLEQAESLPLYATWDEELRKLLLTNRFQSRTKAGYSYSAGQDFPETVVLLTPTESKKHQDQEGKDSRPVQSPLTDVSFTTWPLPNPLLLPSHTTSDISESLQKKNFLNEIFALQKKPGFLRNLPGTFNSKNQFLFPTQSLKEPETNVSYDMINALLQWQKSIKDNKQLSKEDKQAAKEKVSYWPKNVRRSNWSTELMDNDIEFDEPTENALKKQIILWEFIPPNYGGFIWPGIK